MNDKIEAHGGLLMDDPDCRQRVTLENCIEFRIEAA
jgi:hypothetical protein